jgi:cytochrome c peroxidase
LPDRGKFRTPSLRNVAARPPYMHDGSFTSLAQVVDYYNRGGTPNEELDRIVRPLYLTANEQSDVVSFLQSL